MTATRSLVVGQIASHRDCWTFRRTLAERIGCSVRTVQRAITQALSLGLVGVARAKAKTEVPPGLARPVHCGWSHRWTIGWGRAGLAVKNAIEAARAKWSVRVAARATAARSAPVPRGELLQSPKPTRTWTAEELDAELERAAATVPIPPRGPP